MIDKPDTPAPVISETSGVADITQADIQSAEQFYIGMALLSGWSRLELDTLIKAHALQLANARAGEREYILNELQKLADDVREKANNDPMLLAGNIPSRAAGQVEALANGIRNLPPEGE